MYDHMQAHMLKQYLRDGRKIGKLANYNSRLPWGVSITHFQLPHKSNLLENCIALSSISI